MTEMRRTTVTARREDLMTLEAEAKRRDLPMTALVSEAIADKAAQDGQVHGSILDPCSPLSSARVHAWAAQAGRRRLAPRTGKCTSAWT